MAEEDVPQMILGPEENVYSYLLFMVPIERAKSRKGHRQGFNWGIFLAYTLVVVNLVLQLTMLGCVFKSIVLGDINWQLSVYKSAGGPGTCRPEGSLCVENNGQYTCAPPSVQIAGNWDLLDTNKDGIWTRAEVEAAKEDLACRFKVNPVEVFDVFAKMTVARSKVLWVHPDVKAGLAIPKAYFTFAKADVIMCTYRTTDICPNLLMRGFFDSPLMHKNSPRVGNTTESALAYCYNLLKPGGACESFLPSTYAVWKKSSESQCLGTSFKKVTYTNPGNHRSKSMLAVDYGVIGDFKRSDTDFEFAVFKTCIIACYLFVMFVEVKDIIAFCTFGVNMPSAADGEDVQEVGDPAEPGDFKYNLVGLTGKDRFGVMALVIIRIIMCALCTAIGLCFILKTMNVLDLILNALGLLFIVEISSFVFSQMLSPYMTEEFNEAEPVTVPMLGKFASGLHRQPALKDLMYFVLILAICLTCMVVYKFKVTDPASTALSCACLGKGDTCIEAQKFDKDYWSNYWSDDIPNVFSTVNDMKAAHASTLNLHAQEKTLESVAVPTSSSMNKGGKKSLIARRIQHLGN